LNKLNKNNIMKILFKNVLAIIVVLSLSIFSLRAQKGDPNALSNDSHYLTISLTGGASGFSLMPMPDTMRVTSKPFGGVSIGLGYEWHSPTGFWLGTGIEGQLLSARLENTQDIYHIDGVVDAEDDISNIAYNIVKWKERERVLYASVPVVLGYKAESGFYFGVGAKVGLGLYGDITSDFRFTDCTLFYQKYPPMLLKESVEATNAFSHDDGFVGKLNLAPVVELGWQGLDLEREKGGMPIRFKFALYGEFGAMSVYSNDKEGSLLEYGDLNGFDDIRQVMDMIDGINSYYSVMPIGISMQKFNSVKNGGAFTQYSRPSNLHPWFVGVKIGVMFGLPKGKGCNCWKNNVHTPWSKKKTKRGVE
jgi:hypothetical protein